MKKVVIWIFLLAIIGTCKSNSIFNGPFSPEEGLEQYKNMTGRPICYRGSDNPFEANYLGECTWFVYAVRQDALPCRHNGSTWYDDARNAGYIVNSYTPKVGAIAVWDEKVAGTGHVALVTEVYKDGSFEVWDSNWSPKLDCQVRHRMIHSGEPYLRGFIYWKGSNEEPQQCFKPDEWLKGTFAGIAFKKYTGPGGFWNNSTGTSGGVIDDINPDPVSNRINHFKGPIFLKVYAFFRSNSIIHRRLACQLRVYDPSGELLGHYEATNWSIDGWHNLWVMSNFGFKKRGKYRIEIWDTDQHVLAGSGEVTIN